MGTYKDISLQNGQSDIGETHVSSASNSEELLERWDELCSLGTYSQEMLDKLNELNSQRKLQKAIAAKHGAIRLNLLAVPRSAAT